MIPAFKTAARAACVMKFHHWQGYEMIALALRIPRAIANDSS
jgi:hypothetical protein